MDGQFRADLTVRLEDIQTKEELHTLLKKMAAEGSTLDSFPWRIADSMLDVLSQPSASFTYAELAIFCRAEAARNILLAEATWLEDQIATILEHKVQFVCLYRAILLRALREYLEQARLVELPDRAGLTPARWGDHTTPAFVIESHRTELTAVIKQAGVDFQHVLALIGAENPAERFLGPELRHWATGGPLPDPHMVPVEIHIEQARLTIGPAKREKAELLRSGWSVPRYTVSRSDVVTEQPISRRAKSAAPHRPPWPTAVEGERYAIAKDFRAFCDKREGREHPIETDNARLAIRAFLKIARGRPNAKSAGEIEDHLKAARAAAHLPDAETLALLHYFQKKDNGRRVTLEAFRLLVHKHPTRSLYWLEL